MRNGTGRRRAASALAAALIAIGATGCSTAPAPPPVPTPSDGVAIWAAAPVAGAPVGDDPGCPAGPGALTSGTIRDIVHPSAAAARIRIRISNRFGTGPLEVGAATVAIQASGAAIEASTLRRARFGGATAVSVPAGGEADSDWIDLAVTPAGHLAVSLHVLSAIGPSTFHPIARQVSYVSAAGADETAAAYGTAGERPNQCWLYLTGVDGEGGPSGAVVAFGDSITDGVHSTVGADQRWPDFLARRLAAARTGLSVVNAGISGNRVLADGAVGGTTGLSAERRFAADALDVPGARTVLLLEGVNDIGLGDIGRAPRATPAALIAADRRLIAAAHAGGLRVVGCTITPFADAKYWTPQGEAVREAVNRWMLTGGAFDATADTAGALADPQDPERMRRVYDSGDHLHPNDAGDAAIAGAIDLASLTG